MKAMIALVLSLFVSAVAFAAPVKVVSGSVDWVAKSTLGVVKIPGTGGVPTGTVELDATGLASGELAVDLTAYTTGVDKRDEHMHVKYLKTKQWPKATLVIDPVKPTDSEFEWSGKLTLLGETKPVKGKATLKGADLWAEFEVLLTDYPAIGVPEFEGVTVAKTVVVTVKAKTEK